MKPVSIIVRLQENNQERLLATFPPTHPNVYGHHVTVKYGPDADDLAFLRRHGGKQVELKVVSYHEDDKGQAVGVILPDYLERISNRTPHITISTAEGIKPFYSNELVQEPGVSVEDVFWGTLVGYEPKRSNASGDDEPRWYGDATPVELTTTARWLRSEGRSRPAVKAMIRLGLIALEPKVHLTERGEYIVNKLPAGFIEQRRCGQSGERVSIYDAYEANLVEEPDMVDGQDWAKYAIVCEDHATLITGPTLRWVRHHAVVPDWCPVCSGEYEENPSQKKLKARLLR